MATRRERVVLELQDNFTSNVMKAAAATALLKREMDGLNGRGAKVARDLDKADGSVTRLAADVKRSGNDIDHYSGRLRLLSEAAVMLGPALIPVAGAVGGLAAALSAPISAAGGALTVYGLLTGQAVKQTEKQKKEIDQLAKKVQSARTSLANANAAAETSRANSMASAQRSAALSLTSAQQSAQKSIASAQRALVTAKTASQRAAAQQRIDAARASLAQHQARIDQSLSNRQASANASASATQEAAQRRVNEAVKAYQTALNRLSPSQRRFLAAQEDLKNEFRSFITKVGPSMLGPLTTAMKDAGDLLPQVAPLMRETGHAVSILLDAVDRSAKSGSLNDFLHFMERASGTAILSFGRDMGNIGSGIAGLIEASAPLSSSVLPAIERMTGDFASFGQHAGTNGFQDFLDYVREEGPKVIQLMGDLAGAFAAIVRDAAPLGSVVIDVLDDLAKALHTIADSPAGPVLFTTAAGLMAINRAMIVSQAWRTAPLIGFLSGGARKELELTGLAKGIGAVGLSMSVLGSSAGEAGGGLSTLGDALTGAALGSMFGPWGTAIGGAGGALVGFYSEVKKGPQVIGGAIKQVGDYASTFNQLTGAITRATRAQVIHDLQKTGAASAGGSLGIGLKTLTSAALGSTSAKADVNAALANTRGRIASLSKQREEAINANDVDRAKQLTGQIDQLMRSYNRVSQAIDKTSKAIRDQQADIRAASNALHGYVFRLDQIDGRTVAVKIQTRFVYNGVNPSALKSRGTIGPDTTAYADGGTVSGPRHPYGDKVLSMLAPGEEVITNRHGEADRFRADRAAGRIPAYADGGTVAALNRLSAQRATSTSIGIDYGRLAAHLAPQLAQLRPLYGPVHYAGSYDQFMRMANADAQRASLNGMPAVSR